MPRDTGPVQPGDGGPLVDSPSAIPTSVTIDPPTATLMSTDGSQPTQAFVAQVHYDDGTTRSALVTDWSLSSRETGEIDAAGGTFTANGLVGGTATVTVAATTSQGVMNATATVRVVIQRTLIVTGAPDTAPTTFGGATPVTDPNREAGLVYPLDHAVMPQNVYPADVQWTRGNGGDLVRVTMSKTDVTTIAYLVDDGNHHWPADGDQWRAVAQTDPDEEASIRVDRIDPSNGDLVNGSPVHVTFARAALSGSVYYWEITDTGRVQRIDDGTATRVNFMPNPEQGCIGCHSISPSGRYIAARWGGGDNVGNVLDLTTDLTGSPPAGLFPTSNGLYWWFSTWSPDETRLLVAAQGGPQLRLYDPRAGTTVAATGLAGVVGTYPTWSPDGHNIAYLANTNSWGDAPSVGDIALLPVTGPDTFGASTVIHHGGDGSLPNGSCDSYPSWSPDSHLIAFAHGSGARSESASADLYIMNADGTDVRPLTRAASGASIDYQPRFSPFTQGGYFWLSFLSRRIYGNTAIGNTPSVANRRQQIWITAIRMGAAPGEDPSSVPYWLPGQNPRAADIAAYWAPRACRPDGDSCTVGTECCGGECTQDPTTHALVCSPPPPERCHRYTETCSTDGDCCASDNLVCIDHVCNHPLM